MNEFIEQFLVECRELVEQASGDLLALEENPGDIERLEDAFRAFHTLKGSAAIVDFAAMATATHAAEDILARVRSGKASISRGLINDCLACLDLVVQWLDSMQVDGEIPAASQTQADRMAKLFASAQNEGTETVAARVPRHILPPAAWDLMQVQHQLLQEQGSDGLVGRLVSAGRVAINILKSCGLHDRISSFERALAESAAAEQPSALLAVMDGFLHQDTPEFAVAGITSDAVARVLRVDVERVDAIVKLTGELTVAKNAIGHATLLAQTGSDPRALAMMLKDQHAILDRLVIELQRLVLGIRVLPLRNAFQRFPRLVREISETLGKPVKLVTEGDATEADKVVVESLFEPLLHTLRNALDHGVESPAERLTAGKPAIATITMRARRSGDHVIVEIEDDGRGIDVEKIRRLAADRELMDAEALAVLTDEEVIDLIFAAGFSTAEKITDLSGRGVGMNVVRTNVEKLGGSANLSSRPGHGATVRLKLPFSVMMTRVMTVEAGGQTFGIPLDNVVETARVTRDGISWVGAARAFVLRDRTIPVIGLAQTLGVQGKQQSAHEANIVVVTLGGHLGSLEVDRFGDRMDIMLRPLDGLLSGMPGVAGTSLLGDGTVLIVLDLQDLL